MFDEKILAKKIAEEEDLLTQLQMELADKQERKKKVASNIRAITHVRRLLSEIMRLIMYRKSRFWRKT